MNLISIEATDFCLFEHIVLKLCGMGLVWVGGLNKDTDSAISNGAGKSTLLKAIGWGLFGECVDGKSGDEVIRHGTKCATVVIPIRCDSDVWIITRTRRKGQPRVKLQKDGDKKPWSGSRADIQKKINMMIGMDFRAWRNTAMYGQNDRKRFLDPDTKDTERKKLFSSILRHDILELCHEWMKTEALKLKRKAEAIDVEIKELLGRIEEHDIEELESQHAEWEKNRRQRVKDLAEQAREYLEKAKQASEESALANELQEKLLEPAPDVNAAESDFMDANSSKETLFEVLASVKGNFRAAELAVDVVKEKLEFAEGETCPLCTSRLDEGDAAEHIKTLKEELIQCESNRDSIGVNLKASETNLQEAKKVCEEKGKALALARELANKRASISTELARLSTAATRAEEYAQQARSKTADARKTKEEKNPHERQLKSARKKVSEYKATAKTKRSQFDKTNLDHAHYQFWVRGFSSHGLPSFILDSVMPYITERANHYLDILADGDITMNFSTQRELKSAKDEMRDEIDVSWEIEGVSEYPPSGGQLKKMEIATDLALMDLVATREGAHPDILMLDEILDGLDAEGRSRITKLLHELRKSRGTIFVISHDESIAESFEKSIIFVKEDGISSLEMKMAA